MTSRVITQTTGVVHVHQYEIKVNMVYIYTSVKMTKLRNIGIQINMCKVHIFL